MNTAADILNIIDQINASGKVVTSLYANGSELHITTNMLENGRMRFKNAEHSVLEMSAELTKKAIEAGVAHEASSFFTITDNSSAILEFLSNESRESMIELMLAETSEATTEAIAVEKNMTDADFDFLSTLFQTTENNPSIIFTECLVVTKLELEPNQHEHEYDVTIFYRGGNTNDGTTITINDTTFQQLHVLDNLTWYTDDEAQLDETQIDTLYYSFLAEIRNRAIDQLLTASV